MLTRWRDRIDRRLTWKRACTYALVLVVLYVAAWVNVLVEGSLPLNSSNTPVGGDFIAFEAAGRLLLSGHAHELYDRSAIASLESSLVNGRIPGFYDAYRNPPFFALIFAPLALLDLLPAFAVWSLVTLTCLGLALWVSMKETPRLQQRWLGLGILVMAYPPVYFGLIDGENATVSLLLFALIYQALARNHNGTAGAWAALGLFKPQLFLVLPVVFLVSRRWRSLLSYGVITAVLAAVSFVIVGAEGLLAWTRILLEPESANASVNAWRMASAKSFIDSLLPGRYVPALVLYVIVAAILTAVLVWLWIRPRAPLPITWGLTSIIAVLIDPHLVDYDLTVLVSAAVVGAAFVRGIGWPIVLLYLVALFRAQIPIGDASLQLTAPILAVCAVIILRNLLRSSRDHVANLRTKHSPARALVAPR